MRAVVCESWRPHDELELKDVPDAPPPGPEEARIAVTHAGVGWATTLVVSGRYQRKPPLPFSPGAEIAGTVIDAGAAADLAPGDRVCAILDWGGYAEQVTVHRRHVWRVPDALPLGPSAAIPAGYMTGYGALVWRADLQPGEKVLVHGAAGGVGLAAVQVARALGAEVFAVVRGEAKAAFLRDAGVPHVIDSTRTDFLACVREHAPTGVDVVFDPVCGPRFPDTLRTLDVGGRCIVIGFVGGDIPQIPANTLLLKNIHVAGFNMGQHVGWGVKDDRARFAEAYGEGVNQLLQWWTEGRIAPRIHATLPLAQFREAMALVTSREVIGRVLLTP